VFAVSPLFNRIFEGKKDVVVLKTPVLQGQLITPEMLSIVEMGSYNLPEKAIVDPALVSGKYAASDLYAGSLVFSDMLTDSIDTSDSMLRNLKDNERAMSITIKQFANGFSGKLITGDIIKIVSVDDDKNAYIFAELEFVEVLTTTTNNGVDNIERQPMPDENGETGMPVTITVIIQDDLQALRLTECENTSLHAIFVCRDDKQKSELLDWQMELIEQIYEDMENEDEESRYMYDENGVMIDDENT
jgi:pilus assembly protein CpaB